MKDNEIRLRALTRLINSHGNYVKSYMGDLVYTAIAVNESKEHVVIVLREYGIEYLTSYSDYRARRPLYSDFDKWCMLVFDNSDSHTIRNPYMFKQGNREEIEDYFSTAWPVIHLQ